MRFYTNEEDPQRTSTEEMFPEMEETKAAKKLLKCGLLPSVTTVLDVTREDYLERWLQGQVIQEYDRNGGDAKAAIAEVSDRESENAVFGTDCHEVIEKHLLGEDPPDVSDQVKAHSAPLVRWLKDNVKRVIAAEVCRASADLGAAGMIDMAFELNDGTLVVGDLKVVKFSYKFPPKPGFAYRLQLSAYEHMLYEMTGDHYQRVSFYLASPFGWDKKPDFRVFKHTRDYLPAFRLTRQIWEERLLQEELHHERTSSIPVTPGWTPSR